MVPRWDGVGGRGVVLPGFQTFGCKHPRAFSVVASKEEENRTEE